MGGISLWPALLYMKIEQTAKLHRRSHDSIDKKLESASLGAEAYNSISLEGR